MRSKKFFECGLKVAGYSINRRQNYLLRIIPTSIKVQKLLKKER